MATNLIKEKKDLAGKQRFLKAIFKQTKLEDDTEIIWERTNEAKEKVYEKGKRLKKEKILGVYDRYYIVDVGEKMIDIKFQCPSKNCAYDFDVEVRFSCTPNDPIKIVEKKLTHLEYFIECAIFKLLENRTIEYDSTKTFEVRKTLLLDFEEILKGVRADINFNIKIEYLNVKMDPTYLDYLRELERLEHKAILKKKSFYGDNSQHHELKEKLISQLLETGPYSMIFDEYAKNSISVDTEKIINMAIKAELEVYNQKLELFKKAKEEGIVLGEINKYFNEVFSKSDMEQAFNYSKVAKPQPEAPRKEEHNEVRPTGVNLRKPEDPEKKPDVVIPKPKTSEGTGDVIDPFGTTQ